MDLKIEENDIIDFLFTTGSDHVDNFKKIIEIMKLNAIEYLNVVSWDSDAHGHWITGTVSELEPFLKYKVD